PKPDNKRPSLGTPYVAPRNPVEEMLAAIWREILNVHPIGVHDDFFDLGGHSLAATGVISRVVERFQLEIPPQSVFAAQTIAERAEVIGNYRGKQASLTYAQLFPRGDKRTLAPLSFAQQRLWFLNQLDPKSPAYNEPSALRLRGAL